MRPLLYCADITQAQGCYRIYCRDTHATLGMFTRAKYGLGLTLFYREVKPC